MSILALELAPYKLFYYYYYYEIDVLHISHPVLPGYLTYKCKQGKLAATTHSHFPADLAEIDVILTGLTCPLLSAGWGAVLIIYHACM